ncbi:MAG: hypothetical protein ACREOP_01520 [Thermodesulfobacteriota bacterium]
MALSLSVAFNLTNRQQEAQQITEEAFTTSNDAKADVMRKALDHLRIYNTWVARNPSEANQGKRARVATPLGFAIVEQQTARHKSAILPSSPHEPYIRVLPMSLDDIDSAPLAEAWLNWRLDLAQYRRKIEMALRHFNTFGIVPAYPYYDYRTKDRMVRMPMDMINPATGLEERIGLLPPQKTTQIIFKGPNFRPGSISQFFPEPGARIFDGEGMEWVVERDYPTRSELETEVNANPELYNRKVFEMISPLDTPSIVDDPFMSEVTRYYSYQFDASNYSYLKNRLERWTYLSSSRIIQVINREYPIMDIEDPYWLTETPCFVGTRLPQIGFPWGKGAIEPIERIIAHIVSNRNMRLDTVRLNLQPPWIVLKNAVPDLSQIRNGMPNHLIEVLQKNAIEKVKIDDTTSQSYAEEDLLRQDVDLSSNSFGFSSGQIPANIRSATQQLSLMEMVSERDQMDIEAFESSFLKPLATWFVGLGQMFCTTAEMVRFDEEEGYKFPTISPSDLLGQFDFKVVGSARVVPKAVEAQQKQAFIAGIMPILMNPTGLPDVFVKLQAELAKDLGYMSIYKILKDTSKALRVLRFMSGGVIGQGPDVVGGVNQLAQGSRGGAGAGTAPENTITDMNDVVDSVSNQNSVEDIPVS